MKTNRTMGEMTFIIIVKGFNVFLSENNRTSKQKNS